MPNWNKIKNVFNISLSTIRVILWVFISEKFQQWVEQWKAVKCYDFKVWERKTRGKASKKKGRGRREVELRSKKRKRTSS